MMLCEHSEQTMGRQKVVLASRKFDQARMNMMSMEPPYIYTDQGRRLIVEITDIFETVKHCMAAMYGTDLHRRSHSTAKFAGQLNRYTSRTSIRVIQ